MDAPSDMKPSQPMKRYRLEFEALPTKELVNARMVEHHAGDWAKAADMERVVGELTEELNKWKTSIGVTWVPVKEFERYATLEHALAAKEAAIQQLESRLAAAEKACVGACEHCAMLSSQRDAALSKVSQRDAELAAVVGEHNRRRQELVDSNNALHKLLAEKDAEIGRLREQLTKLRNSLNTVYPHPELGAVSVAAWMDSLAYNYSGGLCNHIEEFVIQYVRERDTLQREVAAAKADFEKQKTMTRLEAKANYNAIDEIHLLEAQRDRAEAACAAYVQFIQSIRDAANIPYGTDPDRLLPKIYARCCNMSTAPYPGQRYLDLAKLVEGLPKYTGMVWVMTDLEYGEEVEQQLTTALAALLAWRKSTPPPREQGDSK